ncbi:hypothetical protein BTVI_57828 [Pitangus sulphuratus]|nr:hypothetical protein BTVI_57828 [Pitangus sulphuratus]
MNILFNQKVKMRKSGILTKQYMCRGLFQRGIWFFSSYPEVELETVTVNVTIQDFVADVVSELVFRNVQQVPRETMFIFPVDSNTVVDTFHATMGDSCIEAMLWEKEEAQKLCKATPGMENLRYLQDQWDLWGRVFACFLGMLPPNGEVTISLCYVQELPLQPDGAARFCWPHELFPWIKYPSRISSKEEMSKNLHFSISLKSARGVSHVVINSSYTPLQYTASDQTSAQLFIFIQRKVSSEEEAVMAEVYRYRDHHRCFCFPANRCVNFHLSQAIALETKGECVCIHSRVDMTSKAVKCLQRALQPVASGISLHWDLPPGLEVSLIRKAPETIFQGHQSSIYAQIHGQAQDAKVDEGAATLQYHVGNQFFNYTLRFSLSPSSDDRLPVHRMALMQLLWERAWERTSRAEKDTWQSAVKSSLILGVPSPFTSSVAVRMKHRDAWHREQKPSPEEQVMDELPAFNISWDWAISPLASRLCDFSGLRALVALQKANGSWALSTALASALGLSKADTEGQRPSEDVEPAVWATVLALVWLHKYKWKVPWSELLEAKACRWLQDQAEVQLDECLEAANSLLGCFVEPTVFRMCTYLTAGGGKESGWEHSQES